MLELNAVFIRLSTKILEDFQGVPQFTNIIKKDANRLKKIRITDLLR